MIHYHIHERIIKKENGYIKQGDRVIELGDQEVNIDESRRSAAVGHYLKSQEFYKGIETVSIDINGEHGSLPLDLSKSIPAKSLPEPGDVLTDFGTIEHVKDLYSGLKNSFNLIKVGGLGIHVNPLASGYAANHGFHYFTESFWEGFCKVAGLELVDLFVQAAYHNTETGNELYCIYRKAESSKFPTKKAFDHLYKLHIKKS